MSHANYTVKRRNQEDQKEANRPPFSFKENTANNKNTRNHLNSSLINLQNNSGITPLHRAIGQLKTEEDMALVYHLLEKGADPNLSDKTGTTALHILFRNRSLPVKDLLTIFKWMVPHDLDVNATSSMGETPLMVFVAGSYHWRKKRENRQAIQLLLNALIHMGANPLPSHALSLRASQMARRYRMNKMAEKLEAYEALYASQLGENPPPANKPYPKKKRWNFKTRRNRLMNMNV